MAYRLTSCISQQIKATAKNYRHLRLIRTAQIFINNVYGLRFYSPSTIIRKTYINRSHSITKQATPKSKNITNIPYSIRAQKNISVSCDKMLNGLSSPMHNETFFAVIAGSILCFGFASINMQSKVTADDEQEKEACFQDEEPDVYKYRWSNETGDWQINVKIHKRGMILFITSDYGTRLFKDDAILSVRQYYEKKDFMDQKSHGIEIKYQHPSGTVSTIDMYSYFIDSEQAKNLCEMVCTFAPKCDCSVCK
eukprot:116869_1